MLKLASTAAVIALALSFPSRSHAAEGFFCFTEEFNTMGTAGPENHDFRVTNEAAYECPGIGRVTVPQIYSRGYRVVQFGNDLRTQGAGTPNIRQTVRNWVIVEKI